MFDLNGNYIAEYNSLSEAAKEMGCKHITTLSHCVNQDPKYAKYKTFKGFKWKLV